MWFPITIVLVVVLFLAAKTVKKLLNVVDNGITALDNYSQIAVKHSENALREYSSLDELDLE